MNKCLVSSPIGIFDSGIGGISVAKALMKLLPSENILYFADTQHVPYGKRTFSEIRQYTHAIIDFLVSQNCKMVVIACNTATAAISDAILELSKNKIKIFNVINPVIQHVTKNYQNCKIGLLCTDLTYKLGIFERKIEFSGNNIRLISLKASQLAHLIESEFENKPKLEQLIKEYLFNHQFLDIKAVILGCTHYLWLKEEFLNLNPYIDWIEPSVLLANKIKKYLEKDPQYSHYTNVSPKAIFCQTGDNDKFYRIAKSAIPTNYQIIFYHCYWSDEFNINLVPEAIKFNTNKKDGPHIVQ